MASPTLSTAFRTELYDTNTFADVEVMTKIDHYLFATIPLRIAPRLSPPRRHLLTLPRRTPHPILESTPTAAHLLLSQANKSRPSPSEPAPMSGAFARIEPALLMEEVAPIGGPQHWRLSST